MYAAYARWPQQPEKLRWGRRLGVTTSFTTYQSRGFWADDSTIGVWLYLLADVAAGSAGAGWVAAARGSWAVQARTGFLGCVDVGLDEHLGGDPRREAEFLRLLGRLTDRLTGPQIAAQVATGFAIGGGTIFTEDVDVAVLRDFSAAITALVRGVPAADVVPGA
jgi:hypothetical protein